jgi:hypothetical protein
MAIIMKNKIPSILDDRKMNSTDFHTLLVQRRVTYLSYPIAHELATKEELRDTMSLGNIKKAVVALGVTFNDVIELVEVAA